MFHRSFTCPVKVNLSPPRRAPAIAAPGIEAIEWRRNPYEEEVQRLPGGVKEEPLMYWARELLNQRWYPGALTVLRDNGPPLAVAVDRVERERPANRLLIVGSLATGSEVTLDETIYVAAHYSPSSTGLNSCGGDCRSFDMDMLAGTLTPRNPEELVVLPLDPKQSEGAGVRAELAGAVREASLPAGMGRDPVEDASAFMIFMQMAEDHSVDSTIIQRVTAAHHQYPYNAGQ